MKIAVFMHNRPHLGANILHIPLLYSLYKYYPNAEITLFTEHQTTKLITSIIPIKDIVTSKDIISKIKTYALLNPDITISLRKSSTFLNLGIALFNRKQKYGFQNVFTKYLFQHTAPYNKKIFRADNFLALLPKKIHKTYLHSSNIKKRLFVFMPGGTEKFKHWNIENYIQIANKLHANFPEASIYFIMGNAEDGYRQIIQKNNKDYKCLINLPLNDILHIVSQAYLVIANDCGPSHLAQITQCSTLILYSDEYYTADNTIQEWFRIKSNSKYLQSKQGQSINTISPTEVYEVAVELLQKEQLYSINKRENEKSIYLG